MKKKAEVVEVSLEMVNEWTKGSKKAKGYLMEFIEHNKDNNSALVAVLITIRDIPTLRGKKLKFFFKTICKSDMDLAIKVCGIVPNDIIAEAIELNKDLARVTVGKAAIETLLNDIVKQVKNETL